MRTPRPVSPRRGIQTLIGNGWLHESPKNVWPRSWDVRGRSALRKCMFLPVPPGVRELAPSQVSPAAMAPAPKRPEPPLVPHRHDPARDVQMFAAVSPEEVVAERRRALYAEEKAKVLGKAPPVQAWYEDPVALGTLLIVVPPIGLAALWSSRRYSNDARWALTVMTALVLCLGAAVTITVVALRG